MTPSARKVWTALAGKDSPSSKTDPTAVSLHGSAIWGSRYSSGRVGRSRQRERASSSSGRTTRSSATITVTSRWTCRCNDTAGDAPLLGKEEDMTSLKSVATRIAALASLICILIGATHQQEPGQRPASNPSFAPNGGDTVETDLCATGKCTGSPSCRVCTNCSRCPWCRSGGTCGVCATPRQPPPSPVSPTTPAPKVPSSQLGSVPATRPAATEDGIAVYFSPNGRCTN